MPCLAPMSKAKRTVTNMNISNSVTVWQKKKDENGGQMTLRLCRLDTLDVNIIFFPRHTGPTSYCEWRQYYYKSVVIFFYRTTKI